MEGVGTKADVREVTQASSFSIKRWFYSLYTLYLIDSLGFAQAAVHCLNTLDGNEINQFASAVLAVDVTMSTAGYAVTIWTGEQVFGAIIQGLRWATRPLGRGIVKFFHRYNIPIGTVKKYAAVSGIAALGGAGLWVGDSILSSREQQRLAQELVQKKIEHTREKNSLKQGNY